MVPVLSVNSIFILPDVSIPTSFLTKTLFFSNIFIFDDNTNVTIIGKPSGTLTTIIVTDNVSACNIYANNKDILVIVFIILSISNPLEITILLNK